MLAYPHFAVQNLHLLNGYEESRTPAGIARIYKNEDQLEQCVRRVLLRKPERLSGWDLRFLRRSLELSQEQFGKMVDRDAQTVARWEKSKKGIPAFADLSIRCRFAERFEHAISLREVLSYVDGTGPKLPRSILLMHEGENWTFAFQPRFVLPNSDATTSSTLVLPKKPVSQYVVYTPETIAVVVRNKPTGPIRQKKEGTTYWNIPSGHIYDHGLQEMSVEPLEKIEFRAIGSNDVRANETRH